jgi:DNA topoisomerase I
LAAAVCNRSASIPKEYVAVAARKKKHLVIVESPAKAKTINKYLGPEYEVVASKGHVRDLPKSRFGIDIAKGWIPTYRALKDRKDLLAILKKHAANSDMVYLAPDPDREGEAIAWHLKEALGLKDERVRRVTFNEITKTAVKKAFDAPGTINMDLVAAQEARRFLDRVVGYKLSPLLSRKLAEDLSAGRVQSVAVRLIVEREREIEAFVPEEYWRIAAQVRPKSFAAGGVTPVAQIAMVKAQSKKGKKPGADAKPVEPLPEGAFVAELAEWDGQKFKATNEQEASAVVQGLNGAAYVVSKIEQKDRPDKPPAPFTTSTLQQQAAQRLHFAASRTMKTAQRLYEGVDLGSEGSVALITYMRTDSTRIADEAVNACREHIKAQYGDKYLPEQPNRYAASKDAQGAHEAIRPTDVSYTPEKVAAFLAGDQLRLYTLIYQRFVACQMKPAIFAVTNVEITAAKGLFKAQGKTLKFDGYRKVLSAAGKQEDVLLPTLKEQEALDLLKLAPTQHFTEPPSRYNEASLVKTMEKEGIGRPSTYAAIISKIQDRRYVEQKERRFYATELGKKVTDILVDNFPAVMDVKFTRHMEEELDQIETRKSERNHVLDEFYTPFEQSLELANEKMAVDAEKCPLCGKVLQERFSRFGKFFGCSGYPECKYIKKRTATGAEGEPVVKEPPKETDVKCPTCGKAMLERTGKRGPFLACSGYPECKTTMNLDATGKAVLASRPTEHVCGKCGSPMVLREGPRGPFLGCSAYPKCKNIVDVDASGNPVKPIETGVACEKCGKPMHVKRGPRGPFLGCSGYPSCRSTKPMSPELKEKLKDQLPAPLPKKELPQVEIADTCPECGGPMKIRAARGSYFLGCTKFPKCRGTKPATPELLEQIQSAAAAPV